MRNENLRDYKCLATYLASICVMFTYVRYFSEEKKMFWSVFTFFVLFSYEMIDMWEKMNFCYRFRKDNINQFSRLTDYLIISHKFWLFSKFFYHGLRFISTKPTWFEKWHLCRKKTINHLTEFKNSKFASLKRKSCYFNVFIFIYSKFVLSQRFIYLAFFLVALSDS